MRGDLIFVSDLRVNKRFELRPDISSLALTDAERRHQDASQLPNLSVSLLGGPLLFLKSILKGLAARFEPSVLFEKDAL